MVDEREESSWLRRVWAYICRHKFLFILLTAVIVAVIVVLSVRRYSQSSEQRAGFGRGRGGFNGVSVAVATVTTGDIVVRIPALGTITPLATVTVKTQISGQLQKIAFKEGQLVRQGDFLAQIDPRPYEAALSQVTANMHRDEALLSDAKLNLQRYEALIKEDSVAQQQLDTQKALVNQYEGTVQADQAQIKTANLNLQYTRIVSPLNGRVGLRQVDEGNYVTAGDANGIVVVTELQPITAIFSVPEDNVTAIMRQLHDGETLPVQAFDRSNSSKLADGKLLSIDNQIDATTGTFKLRAVFDNKDDVLFPNQFVNIQLLVKTLHDQVIMPSAAVHRGAPNGQVGSFVYLVNADTSTVSVRPVQLGAVDGERVAVISGVAPNDVVVTEGGDRLRDGAAVTLPGATPESPGAKPKTPGTRPANGDGTRRPRRPPGGAPR